MQKLFFGLQFILKNSFIKTVSYFLCLVISLSGSLVYAGGPAELDIQFPTADIFLLTTGDNPTVITSNEDDGEATSRIIANLEANVFYYLVVLPRNIHEDPAANQYLLSITGPGGISSPPPLDDPWISVSVNDKPFAASFEIAGEIDRYTFLPIESGFHIIELFPAPSNQKPGLPVHWKKPVVPFSLDIGSLGDLSESVISKMVRDAAAVWNNVPAANMQLKEANPLSADVVASDASRITVAGNTLFYDEVRNSVISFGGFDANFSLHDQMFEWDGASWNVLPVENAPPSRAYAASAYDRQRQQLVLFGGYGVSSTGALTPLSDTWIWDGQEWKQATPTNTPPARLFSSMAFDEFFGETVMFGGRDNSTLLNDTWVWDGTDWLNLTNSQFNPSGRFGHQLFFDPANGQIYMIHGTTGSGDFFDMWLWRGTVWSNITDTVDTPDPRAFGKVIADRGRNQTILFGGDSGNTGNFNDTWIWDGSNWTKITTANSPKPRFEFDMVYDESSDQVFIAGGRENDTVLNDNWVWDGENWKRLGQLDDLNGLFTNFAENGINPIVFDNNGNLTDLLLGDGAREFASSFTEITKKDGDEILATRMILNGWFLSSAAGDQQLSQEEFTNEMVHEFGHFLGLTNTQFNTYLQRNNDPSDDTDASLMYPFRLQVMDNELHIHHDDKIALSELYPSSDGALDTQFGSITGHANFNDGKPVIGGLVIARLTSNPAEIVVSRMIDERAQLDNTFHLPGLPPGDYIVGIEPVDPQHFGDASVGFHTVNPLGAAFTNPPAAEYYNGDNEADGLTGDNPSGYTLVSVRAGQTTEINFICDPLTSNRFRQSQLLPYDTPFFSGITTEERGQNVYPYSVGVDEEQTALTVEMTNTETLPLGIRVERAGQVVFSNQPSPEPRRNMAMVYDAANAQTLLFGGWLDTGPENDTWVWNGSRWEVRSSETAPLSRVIHNAVYDEDRQITILFGGSNSPGGDSGGVNYGDTWEWDGNAWTFIDTEQFPVPRIGHSMAYDSTLQTTFIFGGIDPNFSWLNDTWAYDGTSWTQVTTAIQPSARNAHAMVYDKARRQTVLFSGSGNDGIPNNETWTFNGIRWTAQNPSASPPPRRFYAMVYDSNRSVTALFGGADGDGINLNDMWEWTGTTWRRINTLNAPSPRSRHVMAYDSNRGKIVMYGGINDEQIRLTDTWEYDPNTGWVNKTPPVNRSSSFTYSTDNGLQPGIHYLFVYSAGSESGQYTIKVKSDTEDTVSVNNWDLY